MSATKRQRTTIARAATIDIRATAVRVRRWINRQPLTAPISLPALRSACDLQSMEEPVLRLVVSMAVNDATL